MGSLDNILFSFLIPAHNMPTNLLQRLKKSIPEREDVEIIIGDEGADKWTGAGDCRNKLLEKAIGKYIIFADADDCFDTHSLTSVLDKIAESSTVFDIIYWGTTTIDLDGSNSKEQYGYSGEEIVPIHSKVPFVYHGYEAWRKVIRTDFLLEHPEMRFDSCVFSEDVAFAIKLLLSTDRIAVFPPSTYYYIRRGDSLLHYSCGKEELQHVFDSLYLALLLLKGEGYRPYHQYTSAMFLQKVKKVSLCLWCKCLWKELVSFGSMLFLVDIDRSLFHSFFTSTIKTYAKR